MSVIVSKDKCFVVDGTRMSFNSRDVSVLANGVRITNRSTGSYVDIPVTGTTLNGVNATSVQDILDFVDEYFFEIGGGAGGDGGAGNSIEYLGLFEDEQSLRRTHPTGTHRQYAYVKDIDSSGDIHRYFYWGEMAEDWLPLNKSEDDVYSDSDVLTNKIWVDGSKIYRRVSTDINIQNIDNTLEPIDALNIYKVVGLSYIINYDGQFMSSRPEVEVIVSSNSIFVGVSPRITVPCTIDIIVEYTKQ